MANRQERPKVGHQLALSTGMSSRSSGSAWAVDSEGSPFSLAGKVQSAMHKITSKTEPTTGRIMEFPAMDLISLSDKVSKKSMVHGDSCANSLLLGSVNGMHCTHSSSMGSRMRAEVTS